MRHQMPTVPAAGPIGSNCYILDQHAIRLEYQFNDRHQTVVNEEQIDDVIANSLIVISRHWLRLAPHHRHPLCVGSAHQEADGRSIFGSCTAKVFRQDLRSHWRRSNLAEID
jgi:hypothetical protein